MTPLTKLPPLHVRTLYGIGRSFPAARLGARESRPRTLLFGEHGSGLGRFRWVIERTFAWLHHCKRLLIRYERRAEIHSALLGLGCCLVTGPEKGAGLFSGNVRRRADV